MKTEIKDKKMYVSEVKHGVEIEYKRGADQLRIHIDGYTVLEVNGLIDARLPVQLISGEQ